MKRSRMNVVLVSVLVLAGIVAARAEVISASGDCHESVKFHKAVTITGTNLTVNGTNFATTVGRIGTLEAGGNLSLASNTVFVGNGLGKASPVTLSGDLSITTNGAATIADNAVLAPEVGAGALASDVTVTNANYGIASIEGNKIIAGTLSNTLYAAGSISGDKIIAGTVSNGNLAADGLSASKLTVGALPAAQLTNAVCSFIDAGTTVLGAGGTETIVYHVTFAGNPYVVASYGEDPQDTNVLFVASSGTTSCSVTGRASKRINWVAIYR